MVKFEDLKPGVVAILNDGRIAVIVDVHLNRPKNPFGIKLKADGPKYVGPLDGFRAIVGKVDLDAFNQSNRKAVPEWNPMSSIHATLDNDKIKNIQPGDDVLVRHGRSVVTAKFVGWNWNRPKYPASYSINGKSWKGSANTIISKVG